MKKDFLPLYIAITSGVFGLLSQIVDKLGKTIPVPTTQAVQGTSERISQKVMSYAPKQFDLIQFILANPKPIFFGVISVVAIVVFCIIKFKKHRINRRKK